MPRTAACAAWCVAAPPPGRTRSLRPCTGRPTTPRRRTARRRAPRRRSAAAARSVQSGRAQKGWSGRRQPCSCSHDHRRRAARRRSRGPRPLRARGAVSARDAGEMFFKRFSKVFSNGWPVNSPRGPRANAARLERAGARAPRGVIGEAQLVSHLDHRRLDLLAWLGLGLGLVSAVGGVGVRGPGLSQG